MQKELYKIINILKTNPELFLINDNSYSANKNFINGLLFGIDISTKREFQLEFSRFVNNKILKKNISNLSWSISFEQKYHERSDDEKIKMLYKLLNKWITISIVNL